MIELRQDVKLGTGGLGGDPIGIGIVPAADQGQCGGTDLSAVDRASVAVGGNVHRREDARVVRRLQGVTDGRGASLRPPYDS